jgi:hypothetical protein
VLLEGVYPRVSHGFWTLVVGVVILAPISIALKSYNEIKILRYFFTILPPVISLSWLGFLATSSVVVVSLVLSLVFFFSKDYPAERIASHFDHSFFNRDTYAYAYSVFTFAFGATAIVFILFGSFPKSPSVSEYPSKDVSPKRMVKSCFCRVWSFNASVHTISCGWIFCIRSLFGSN